MRVVRRVAIRERSGLLLFRRSSPGTAASGRQAPTVAVVTPLVTAWTSATGAPSLRTAGWRLGVLRRVEAMEAELDTYEQQLVTGPTGLRLRATLKAARAACGTQPPTLRDWWTGQRVERAWQLVHKAGALMPMIAPTSELARMRNFAKDAAAGLPKSDGRRVAIEADDLGTRLSDGHTKDGDRWLIADTIRGAYLAADERFIALRAWRNRLDVTAARVAAALVCLCLALTRWPTIVPLCFTQDNGTLCPRGLRADPATTTPRDVLVVVVAGIVGALVVAIAAIRKGSPTTTVYRLTPALTAVIPPSGSLRAVSAGVRLGRSPWR